MTTPLIDSVVPDMLHLRLGLARILLRNSILSCADFTNDPLAKRLEALCRSVGVRLTTYYSKRPGQPVAFSPLTGAEIRKALSVLGPVFLESVGVFPEPHKIALGNMWMQTSHDLEFVNNCKKEDAPEAAVRGRSWTIQFLQCDQIGLKGFSRRNITPYAHWFGVHLARIIQLFGGLGKYSGEALEKKNDLVKKTLLRQTNHRDILETLKVEKRREEAEHQLQLMEKEKLVDFRIKQIICELTLLIHSQVKESKCHLSN